MNRGPTPPDMPPSRTEPQTRRSRAEQQQDTRRRLLDAAAEVFAEHGFDGASIDEISARAGFTRGAFYSNFSDKTDLLITLCDRRIAEFAHTELPAVLEVPFPQRAGMVARWLADNPLPIEVLLLVELARHGQSRPESAATVERVVNAVLDAIAGLMVQDGSNLAHLRAEDVDRRAQAILGAVLGLDLLGHLGVAKDPQMIEVLISGITDVKGPS